MFSSSKHLREVLHDLKMNQNMPKLPDNWGKIPDDFSSEKYFAKRAIVFEDNSVPVIQTAMSFDNFFHPNKFVHIDSSLMIGQRDFIQLRLQKDRWKVYIEDKCLFFDIALINNDWDNAVRDENLCKQIIHYFRLSEARGEFKFEALCEKCNNTKVIIKDVVTHSVWNGIPINIHQKQEEKCTCTNNF